MKKEKIKWDDYTMETTQDRYGLTAFRYNVTLKGKWADTVIYSDCSHRRAEELFLKRRMEKMEHVELN